VNGFGWSLYENKLQVSGVGAEKALTGTLF
jgi:hypothetical protein